MALRMMPGFGNDFETEALAGALPQGQNSPQRGAYGLYAEQLRGRPSPRRAAPTSAPGSTASGPRCSIRAVPADSRCLTGRPRRTSSTTACRSASCAGIRAAAGRPPDFLTGMRTMTTAGDVYAQVGMAAHVYLVTAGMGDEYFFNADGELLIVPQMGRSALFTELGAHGGRPRRNRRRAARYEVQGGLVGRARARLCLRKLRRPSSRCRTAGRSARTAWPIRATSRRRWPPTRTRSALDRWS